MGPGPLERRQIPPLQHRFASLEAGLLVPLIGRFLPVPGVLGADVERVLRTVGSRQRVFLRRGTRRFRVFLGLLVLSFKGLTELLALPVPFLIAGHNASYLICCLLSSKTGTIEPQK